MTHRSPRIVTVSIPAPGLSAEAFLRQGAGGARGVWARGARWVAHRGVAHEIRVDEEDGSRRFEEVRARAAEVRAVAGGRGAPEGGSRAASRAGQGVLDERPPAVGLRYFGGFAFRADHHEEDMWRGFPSALFHLPALELEGGGDSAPMLTARAAVPEGAMEHDVARELDRRLERLRAELAEVSAAVRADADARVGGVARIGATWRESDRRRWERAVEECLESIGSGAVAKVVLARTLDVETDARLDPLDVALHLWEANRGSHVFLFEPAPGTALVGAAPETVATLHGRSFHATAVAGSIRRGDSPEEQAALAARLLASEKDRAEQRIALDDMLARLARVARDVVVDEVPHVLTLARIQHLETRIRARIPPGVDLLDLVALLHPTPAVCGLPRDAALRLLAAEEPFRRGWYAGPVGWFDDGGNGVFAPALRTGVCRDRRWRLFAGAGIVEGSVPALEWEETGMKFEPMSRALEASGAAGRVPSAAARSRP